MIIERVIEWLGGGILAWFAYVVIYVMGANDRATEWLFNNRAAINDWLKPLGCYLSEGQTWRDMAPCEVEWVIAPIGTPLNKLRQLPSRKVKRLVKTKDLALILARFKTRGKLVNPALKGAFK